MKFFHNRSQLKSLAIWILPLAFLLSCSSGHDESDGHDDHDHGEETHVEQQAGDQEGGHDDHEEGGHIELTEKQYRSAGIEIVTANPGSVYEALTLPGTIAPNADAVLHVTPRVSGQVRKALKHLGESVEAGELLCVLDSVDLGAAVADFLRAQAMASAARETLDREQELFVGRLEALTTVLQGAIQVQERIYSRERKLQEKGVSTIRPLLEAEKALQLAKLEKDSRLTELRAERDTRILELDVMLRGDLISLTAATNRLRTLGLTPQDLATLDENSPLLSGEYRVYSPGSGIIVNRHVSTGEFVEAGAKLYIIENLSSVWFVASAFETQLQSIHRGQPAHVSLDAFPGVQLNGVVSFLDYHVDPISRAVGVRITLDNEQLASWPEALPLRPGMFGRVQLETASREAAVVLPEHALVHDDIGDYVFVQVEPLAFVRRDVEVKLVAGEIVEVLSGLKAGEKVASSGTFLLKSAERQSELGGGHSH